MVNKYNDKFEYKIINSITNNMNHTEFVNQCMLTCIGNKRRLLKNIVDTIEE